MKRVCDHSKHFRGDTVTMATSKENQEQGHKSEVNHGLEGTADPDILNPLLVDLVSPEMQS